MSACLWCLAPRPSPATGWLMRRDGEALCYECSTGMITDPLVLKRQDERLVHAWTNAVAVRHINARVKDTP